jgi:hypothetical protein
VTTKRRTRSSRARRKTEPATEEELAAAAPAEEPQPPLEAAPPPEAALPPASAPEPIFAARVPPPLPPRAAPATRRAVFFDVENTSRAEHIERVLQHLRLDWIAQATELVAVGNWRVVGHETARLLAHRGAHLVHSAPATGVRDWSDLRIAVAAGVWLASARPGDVIEIITDDQAFDAVGDVATSLGISFRRLSYRALAGVLSEPPAAEPTTTSSGRSRRRRRGGRRGRYESAPRSAPHAAPHAAAASSAEPHTAPQDELVDVARSLIVQAPDRTVSLDALSNALKARGFRRTPGSLRLITRLRRIKELDVSRTGMIRLVDETLAGEGLNGHAHEPAEAAGGEGATEAAAEAGEPGGGPSDETGTTPAAGGGRRRRRRGGRRRRGRGGGQTAAAAT